MRIILSFIVSVFLIVSCKQKDKKATAEETALPENKKLADSVLVTDSTWGWIDNATDFEGLKKLYGESNVKDDTICGPECVDSVTVTMVYPGSNKQFVIYWEDSFYHKQIGFIRCYGTDAPYHTAGGIKIGTTLKELVQMNGEPITFSGFGWDYGGNIISLNHGILENSNVHFSLDLMDYSGEAEGIIGDTEVNSDMPGVKKLDTKIKVIELFLPINRSR